MNIKKEPINGSGVECCVAEMDCSQDKRMHRRAPNCKTIPAAVRGSQRLALSLSILDGAVGKKARQKCGTAIKSWPWALLHSEPFTADSRVLSLSFSLSLLPSGSPFCLQSIDCIKNACSAPAVLHSIEMKPSYLCHVVKKSLQNKDFHVLFFLVCMVATSPAPFSG